MEIAPFDPVISEGRLFGRGSCDTKRAWPRCSMRWVTRSRIAASQSDRRQRSRNEERGSVGVRDVLAHLGSRRPQWAIATEPTGLRVVTHHKGIALLRLDARGVVCHSSDPAQGTQHPISALARAVLLVIEALGLRLAARADPVLSPGTIFRSARSVAARRRTSCPMQPGCSAIGVCCREGRRRACRDEVTAALAGRPGSRMSPSRCASSASPPSAPRMITLPCVTAHVHWCQALDPARRRCVRHRRTSACSPTPGSRASSSARAPVHRRIPRVRPGGRGRNCEPAVSQDPSRRPTTAGRSHRVRLHVFASRVGARTEVRSMRVPSIAARAHCSRRETERILRAEQASPARSTACAGAQCVASRRLKEEVDEPSLEGAGRLHAARARERVFRDVVRRLLRRNAQDLVDLCTVDARRSFEGRRDPLLSRLCIGGVAVSRRAGRRPRRRASRVSAGVGDAQHEAIEGFVVWSRKHRSR